MATLASVEINPNLRVDGDCTVADLDHDVVGGPLEVGDMVLVAESTSGLYGRGWVVELDQEERAVVLRVEWGSLRLPDNSAAAAHVEEPNYRLPVPMLAGRVA